MTTQLEHFLNYYMNTEAPGYAVLVTGDWGTGKTFQVCHYLAEKERWYVSVYGLGSANDIHSAILSQIDPKLELTKTAVTKIGEMSKNVGGLFAVGNVLSGMANNILRCELKPCRTLVSSSTVSPEVRRPGSNKIKTLGGDSGRRCLKCSGKLWPGIARIIPLSSGITAITSLKYVVSMTETPHVCPCQESRPLSISQIAQNRREGKRVKQSVIATLGRLDKLTASGAIDQLLRSAARFAERVMVLSEHSRDAHDRPDANVVSIGPALIFERLWRETGCQEVVRKLLATRHHHFDVERAVFMTVLHRLMVSGSDRSALQWRRDQAIDGTAGLELQHLYRAMGWLGEALGEREPDAPSPRRVKDIIEEELFARRRDLFSALDLVFFDTTSLFFTGNGGDTLGQYGKSKDHRSDCKQMVLGMVIDGDGIPVCSEMWPGNTTDVTTLDQVAQRLQSRFGVRRVCLVADAGMISKKMIAAVEARGWFYILGARLRRTKEVRDVVLSDTGAFETVEVARQRPDPMELQVKEVTVHDTPSKGTVKEPDKPRRYVVCRNPDQTRKGCSHA